MYLTALIALAAMLVGPRLADRASESQDAAAIEFASDAEHLAMLATFNGLAQAQEGAASSETLANPESNRERAGTASKNQQLIERALEVAREIDPQLGRRLATLHEKNPASFERVMRHGSVGKNLFAMAHLKHRDPELYQVKLGEMMQTVQVNGAAAQLREAIRNNSAGQVASLKKQLRTMLQIQLAMQIKNRGDYICRIEEQLAHAREELDREAGSFQETVEARLNALMQLPAGEGSEEDELNLQLNPIKPAE